MTKKRKLEAERDRANQISREMAESRTTAWAEATAANVRAADAEARIAELEIAAKAYLAEYDSPIPDYNHRGRLRMRLREVVRAIPPEEKKSSP